MTDKILDLQALNAEFEALILHEKAAANGNKPLVYSESERGVMLSIAAKTAMHMATRIERRLAELERKVDEQPFRYEGVYEQNKTYRAGSFVTHSGGLWHANRVTAQRPGDHPTAWSLAVKAGRDAR